MFIIKPVLSFISDGILHPPPGREFGWRRKISTPPGREFRQRWKNFFFCCWGTTTTSFYPPPAPNQKNLYTQLALVKLWQRTPEVNSQHGRREKNRIVKYSLPRLMLLYSGELLKKTQHLLLLYCYFLFFIQYSFNSYIL